MSWYNTVVLSFNCAEYEDEEDESCHDCVALRGITAWLREQGYSKLSDLNSYKSGKLGSNAVLIGGCYNHLDVDAFFEVVGGQDWKYRDDVQILFWDDNAGKVSIFDLPRPKVAKTSKRRRP